MSTCSNWDTMSSSACAGSVCLRACSTPTPGVSPTVSTSRPAKTFSCRNSCSHGSLVAWAARPSPSLSLKLLGQIWWMTPELPPRVPSVIRFLPARPCALQHTVNLRRAWPSRLPGSRNELDGACSKIRETTGSPSQGGTPVVEALVGAYGHRAASDHFRSLLAGAPGARPACVPGAPGNARKALPWPHPPTGGDSSPSVSASR